MALGCAPLKSHTPNLSPGPERFIVCAGCINPPSPVGKPDNSLLRYCLPSKSSAPSGFGTYHEHRTEECRSGLITDMHTHSERSHTLAWLILFKLFHMTVLFFNRVIINTLEMPECVRRGQIKHKDHTFGETTPLCMEAKPNLNT